MDPEYYAVVAMLVTPKIADWKVKFSEFKELTKAAGYIIVGEISQFRQSPSSAFLFGKGKVEEIKRLAEERGAGTIIVWNELKSIQKLNLERSIGLRVIDRYELVLEVFQRNAGDKLSKMQIELAYLEKLIPYFKLRERVLHGSKDKPFFKAGGEYGWVPKVAWLRRRRSKLLKEIEAELNKKVTEIKKRKDLGFKIVTIIGYYNAGKTSLFNALTGENKLVSPQPFTTLSSKYSRLRGTGNVLLVDTIGFASDLNPKIISSFRVNLEDMTEAHLLLWVIDISEEDSILEMKIKATTEILKKTGLLEKPVIVVANKIDLVKNTLNTRLEFLKNTLYKYAGTEYKIVAVSAKTNTHLEDLINTILEAC
ncbi:MAG: GTPase HflX [Crenarchaeota archaeon]|nr:GTPase HflX [Thermoproteota archaeon]